MAAPVDDAYACPLHGAVAAGRHLLPDWVPTVGEIVDVSLNTLYDVRGADTVTASQMDGWAGAAYARTYGEYGSLVFHTGGHIALDSNAVYSYDVGERMFRQERAPAQQFLDADRYIADAETGWMWAANLSTAVQVGEPFGTHTYNWLLWLPPDVLPAAPFGYLYTPGRGSMSQPGQRSTNQPHKYALGSFQPWTFAGAPLVQRPAHSFAFLDEKRRHVVLGNGDVTGSVIYWVDPVTGEAGTINFPLPGQSFKPYYHYGFHATTDDLYLSVRFSADAGFQMRMIDPAAVASFVPATAGTPPSGIAGEMAIEWVEPWRSLVFFAGSSQVWTLTAPADPRNGVWQWSNQALTGTVRQLSANAPPFTKFRYIDRLRVFLWPTTHGQPVQAFRINPP